MLYTAIGINLHAEHKLDWQKKNCGFGNGPVNLRTKQKFGLL
jgi:hypothetical protein